jgi:hypothetical protein
MPDFDLIGDQTVYIIIEDSHFNKTEYTAVLTIINDTTPPVIHGVRNRSIIIGDSISYREGVTVTDDYDPNPQLIIDSSGVNLNQAGVYTVIYSATDISGNRSEARSTVTVRGIDMDLVNELADGILSRIINNSMSQRQKARAIYNWVDARVSYTTRNPTRNLAQGAYNAFTRGSGDCYTYMAASRVLLTRAGISNQTAKRYGGETDHYWNLVNTGDGWHHFDVCPTPGNLVTINQRFMFTETQAEQYTQTLISRRANYYVYEKTGSPEVVK